MSLSKDISAELFAIVFDEIAIINNPINIICITIDDQNVIEELDGENVKRYISMDIAFAYTSLLNPYIDSFSNSNNTVDNGDHLDGAMEAICRFFQTSTKNTLSEKEKNSLDIKWDDVRDGNFESLEMLYTGYKSR